MRSQRMIGLFLVLLMILVVVGTVRAQGDYVADLGFRPGTNGFGFENYGEGNTDLTSAEVLRMFGEVVCNGGAGDPDSGCDLTPTAQLWMETTNTDMSGGHCEGMAALSLLFYVGQAAPDQFGGGQAADLQLGGNELLQREIAYWWATQTTAPTYSNTIYGTPSQIVDQLIESMNNQGETYTIGIYMRDGSGGHAITPYAVTDEGNGIQWIMVYDNNWPGDERHIEVDRNADTWQYNAAINPNEPESLYEGDASTNTLSLTPTSARLESQDCPFCGDADYEAEGYTGVVISAKGARPKVSDSKGRSTGFLKNKFINEIPGAMVRRPKNYISSRQPIIIYIPNGSAFQVSVTQGEDTPQGETATITIIRQGVVTRLNNIELDDTEDFVDFDEQGDFQYTSGDGGETPQIQQGLTTGGNDYLYEVQGKSDMSNGGTLKFTFDPDTGKFTIGGSDDNQYTVNVERIDDQGKVDNFYTDSLDIGGGDNANLNADDWAEGGNITGEITDDQGNVKEALDIDNEPPPTDEAPVTEEAPIVDETPTEAAPPTEEASPADQPPSDQSGGDSGGDSGGG